MKGYKNMIGLSAVLLMLVFAVPRLTIGISSRPETIFSIAWIAIALLIIAAYLHDILAVDDEARKEMERIKLMRRVRFEQKLQAMLVRDKS